MTEPQQPDPTDYPPHWGYHDSGHRSSAEPASPVRPTTSGMGFPNDYQPTDDTPYPAHWPV
jgi:hypothetical protein